MPSPPTPDPGDTLDPRIREATAFASGRYTRRRVLGEGGQKVVYLVHDEVLDRDCALSMIKADLLEPDDLERFQREARAMARLDHPNIVAVYEVSEEAGRPFFVCQYISGGDLRRELRAAGGPLPVERALTIAADLCRALAHAHEHGIVHRDVKPANVLLTSDGAAKLGDLGLATAADRSRLTLAGSFLGTAAYMAPEQALGEPVDARSDLYSLGALLYEMVCGRPPFVDDNATAVIAQHINARPSAPSQRRRDLPPALDALILRLLAKSPDERPQSAAAVGEELHRISESLREPASERTRFERPIAPVLHGDGKRPRMNRRRRVLVGGAALLVVAGVAVAATLVFALRGHGPARKTVASLPLVPEGYVPVLEPRECPTELTSDPAVVCHDLVVPETRSNPAGRQIRIFVMVAPSRVQPAGIPTVFIGGPSGTAGGIFGTGFSSGGGVFSQPAGSDVRGYGDVVAVSVRGRQFSQPVLTCPEVDGVWRERLALPENGPEANKLWLDAAEQCGRRLADEGVDLNAYGQDEIVKDVRDLAIAMRWIQINVQGRVDLSRTAVLLAARYPGLVRSVVLDAPFPVDATWYDDRLSNINSAFQAYYAACRDDPACDKAFPNLEQAGSAVYAQRQQDPAVIAVPAPAGGPDISVMMDGDRLVYIGTGGLSTQTILPIFAALSVSPEERARPSAGADYVVLVSAPDPSGDPWGADFSAYCEDLDQHVVRGALAVAETLYPQFRVFAHDPLFDLCPSWPTQEHSRAIRPLETASAVPALILAGELDPLAGRAYAERAAKAFTHPTVAVFPNLTHDGGVLADGPPCISALRLAFLRDPTAKLDVDGCIAKVPPIAFAGT